VEEKTGGEINKPNVREIDLLSCLAASIPLRLKALELYEKATSVAEYDGMGLWPIMDCFGPASVAGHLADVIDTFLY